MPAIKTRRLSDLYKLGRIFTLDDGGGDPITVYLQKLNPVETETAVRKANAVRASYLLQKKDPTSDIYLNALNELLDFSDEELMEYAVADELARRSDALEAEWAEDEGWNKEDYLQSLWDAWQEEGTQERFFVEEGETPDPESQRIFDEMQRYNNGLAEHLEKHRVYLREEYGGFSRERLTEMMVDRITKMQADLGWMIEYRKCEVWMGVRVSGKDRQRYFNHRSEVDELESEALTQLIEAMSGLTVEVDQGKDSEETDLSSSSSESPDPQETVSSSSPEE